MQENKAVRSPAMSFIVRVWRDGEGVPSMRGEVEHVGTGEKRFFLDYWSLLQLLDGWRQELDLAG